jgi:hypothetical protein
MAREKGPFGAKSGKPAGTLLVPAVVLLLLAGAGCGVKVHPQLGNSLGMDAYEQMGTIEQRDVALALYIDPKISQMKVTRQLRSGEFTFEIGRAFSAKLVKAVAHNFRKIVLVDRPYYRGREPLEALMRVTLTDSDVDMSVEAGFAKVYADSYVRLAVRAEIKDLAEDRTVWVGTAQVQQELSHEEFGQMTYQEAGRGFAKGIDAVNDKAVGALMSQMRKSANLKKYFGRWQGQAVPEGASEIPAEASSEVTRQDAETN